MLFSIAFGVPEKSVFTRLFCAFATTMLANFQDRLVMTASITLRVQSAVWQTVSDIQNLHRGNRLPTQISIAQFLSFVKTNPAIFKRFLISIHHRNAGFSCLCRAAQN